MHVLDLLPQPEKLRHRLQQRRRLRAENDRQLAERVRRVVQQRHLVFHRRPVLVFETALERHRHRVRHEKRHQLARRRHHLLDRVENALDAPLRRDDRGVVREDLVDERGAVRAHLMRQRVDLAHDLLVEHQTVQCFFHAVHHLFFLTASYTRARNLSTVFI